MTMNELDGWIEQVKMLDQEREEAHYLGFFQKKIALSAVKAKYKWAQGAVELHFDNMDDVTKENAMVVLKYLEDTLNNW